MGGLNLYAPLSSALGDRKLSGWFKCQVLGRCFLLVLFGESSCDFVQDKKLADSGAPRILCRQRKLRQALSADCESKSIVMRVPTGEFELT